MAGAILLAVDLYIRRDSSNDTNQCLVPSSLTFNIVSNRTQYLRYGYMLLFPFCLFLLYVYI